MKISSSIDQLVVKENSKVQPENTAPIERVASAKFLDAELLNSEGKPKKEAYQTAVNKLNEFMASTNKSSKFIFHEGLEKYYVEIVDSQTEEVVKEIPPKELLDAYYEMQKLVGKIFDTQV